MDPIALWQRYKNLLCPCPSVGLTLDVSRLGFADDFFEQMEPAAQKAFAAMARLEAGEKVNPDEKDDQGNPGRMVGHYWLRAPHLAPMGHASPELAVQIEQVIAEVKAFAAKVHQGDIKPPNDTGARKFTDVLHVGIGGSALGPQLLADALGSLEGRRDRLALHFLDNTDPDGFDRELAALGTRLKSTLVVVVSKSGTTPETRNGMLEVEAHFARKGLDFARHAVAVTGRGSELDQRAESNGWLARFPMWDWVGGRTSLWSAVGLLPAALLGADIDSLLTGAAAMDELTRQRDTLKNPAALLALAWHFATGGRGHKDMVVLPYKDRLLLLSRYLQQLVMESLGKELNLDKTTKVNQGINVFGNKGSTDQHAYVQQLRDGVANFFVTFIVVLRDRSPRASRLTPQVEDGVVSGDFLLGFWLGTRTALYEKGRPSLSIMLDKLEPRTLGGLLALYERAVGFYATLVDINAYHQPGVEGGKKAAAAVIATQRAVVNFLRDEQTSFSPDELAERLGAPHDIETIHHVLEHLAANQRGVARVRGKYRWKG